VLVIGGSVADFRFFLQLKGINPKIIILVLERLERDADTAAHKVDEFAVELGSLYLQGALDLKDYREEQELPRRGLRFFFLSRMINGVSKPMEHRVNGIGGGSRASLIF